MMAPAGLQLDDVSAGYVAGRAVVRSVTGALRPGEVTALLGPNGAGKSTLLRGVLGVLPWLDGEVSLDGQALRARSPAWRARRIGYVPQQGGVRFGFTVEQVVAMGRHAHGHGAERRDTVEAALRRCDVETLRERPFAELSGGQQRRVLLARAVAQVADDAGRAVLADEPTAGLDLEHVDTAMAALRGLARRGLAVVVVLHDVNLAARWADAVWLLDGGVVVAQGTPAEVVTPAVLGPVYRVRLRALADEATGGAVLVSEPGASPPAGAR